MTLPLLAISVRQPWAWAIVYAGKTHENRSGAAVGYMGNAVGKRIAVHASLGMTRNEYLEACEFMRDIGVSPPPARDLKRGGIIGSVLVTGITLPKEKPASRWFFGPRADPRRCAAAAVRRRHGRARHLQARGKRQRARPARAVDAAEAD